MKMFTLALFGTAALMVMADTKDKKDVTDKDFVMKASAGGLAEVHLGKFAARRGSHADVKKFGQKMADDHDKANKELADLADKKRLKVAERMDDKHREMARKLLRLKGEDFDRAYMQGQVKDHEEAIALFEAKSKGEGEGDDALKSWAKEKLPTLRMHLKMAQDIERRLSEGKK